MQYETYLRVFGDERLAAMFYKYGHPLMWPFISSEKPNAFKDWRQWFEERTVQKIIGPIKQRHLFEVGYQKGLSKLHPNVTQEEFDLIIEGAILDAYSSVMDGDPKENIQIMSQGIPAFTVIDGGKE